MAKKCGSKELAEKVKEIMDDNLAFRARGEIGVENLKADAFPGDCPSEALAVGPLSGASVQIKKEIR